MEFSKAGLGITELCTSVAGRREENSQGCGRAPGMPPNKYRRTITGAFAVYSATETCFLICKMGLIAAPTSAKAVMRIKGLSNLYNRVRHIVSTR